MTSFCISFPFFNIKWLLQTGSEPNKDSCSLQLLPSPMQGDGFCNCLQLFANITAAFVHSSNCMTQNGTCEQETRSHHETSMEAGVPERSRVDPGLGTVSCCRNTTLNWFPHGVIKKAASHLSGVSAFPDRCSVLPPRPGGPAPLHSWAGQGRAGQCVPGWLLLCIPEARRKWHPLRMAAWSGGGWAWTAHGPGWHLPTLANLQNRSTPGPGTD